MFQLSFSYYACHFTVIKDYLYLPHIRLLDLSGCLISVCLPRLKRIRRHADVILGHFTHSHRGNSNASSLLYSGHLMFPFSVKVEY